MTGDRTPEQLELPLEGGGFPFHTGDLVQVKMEPDAPFDHLMEILYCEHQHGKVHLRHPEGVLRIGSSRPDVCGADQIVRYWRQV